MRSHRCIGMLPWVVAVAGLTILAAFLFRLQNVVSLDDGLRHAMMGKAMAEQGILALPGWSRWFFTGYFHDHPVDPWFLADVLYVPFAGFPLAVALKLFTVCSVALLVGCFLLCLRAFRVDSLAAALLVLLLLFGHPSFTHRLLFGRPFVVITALTLLLLLAVVRERPWAAGVLLCVLTLLSHIFLFALAVSIVGCAWLWRGGRKRQAVSLLSWSVLGVVAGMALHPFPLEYGRYLFLVLGRTPFLALPDRGNEMFSGLGYGEGLYPLLGLAVFLHVILFRWSRGGKRRVPSDMLLLWILVTLFTALFFLWMRVIDLLWPMLLLLWGALVVEGRHQAQLSGGAFPLGAFWSGRFAAATATLVAVFCFLTFFPLARAVSRTDAERSLHPLERALRAVPSKMRVLNVEWDEFPALVAARPDLRYAFGIDSALTLVSDSGSTALLRMIEFPRSLPDVRDSIDAVSWLSALTRRNPADYVLFSVPRTEPIVRALRSKGMTDLSGDPEKWAVFRVSGGVL